MMYATGVNLASAARMEIDPTGKVSPSIGNARVFFDGTQAQLLAVNASQVAAVVPFDVDGKTSVQVHLEPKSKCRLASPAIIRPRRQW